MSRWMCSITLSGLVLVSVTGCNGHRIQRPYWLSFKPFSFGANEVVEETVTSEPIESGAVVTEGVGSEGSLPGGPFPASEVVDEAPQRFSSDSVILDSGMDVTPLRSGTLTAPSDADEREPAPLNLLPE